MRCVLLHKMRLLLMSFQPSFAVHNPTRGLIVLPFIRRAVHSRRRHRRFIVLSAAEFYRVGEYALMLLAGGRYSWLVVLGAFMLAGMLANPSGG